MGHDVLTKNKTRIRRGGGLLLTSFWFLIPACMSKHMPSTMWDEITYPFPNFNGCTVEVLEWISYFILHFTGRVITYPRWD